MIPVSCCPGCELTLFDPAERCPNCGGALVHEEREGAAVVLAGTELQSPAEGWTAPHRLVLVELDGGGRTLALAGASLPSAGERGRIEADREGHFLWKPSA